MRAGDGVESGHADRIGELAGDSALTTCRTAASGTRSNPASSAARHPTAGKSIAVELFVDDAAPRVGKIARIQVPESSA